MATWSDTAVRHLSDTTLCPRCGWSLVEVGHCAHCGADLTGPLAHELWDATRAVIEAINVRSALLARLTTATVARPATSAASPVRLTDAPAVAAPAVVRAQPTHSNSQVTLQSVLALAGAGLVAIAAIVFTFLNPDLTDTATRTLITVAVTAVFIAGAWLLAGQGLTFSAETVGTLALVFVVLDIRSVAAIVPEGAATLLVAAGATLLASIALVPLALRTGLRSWLLAAVAGALVTPALVGNAFDAPWLSVAATLGVGAVALAAHPALALVGPRFARGLAAHRALATVGQFAVLACAPIQLAVLAWAQPSTATALGSAAVIAALAVQAGVAARFGPASVWSYACGGLWVLAAGILPLATLGTPVALDTVWLVAAGPLAAGAALVVLARLVVSRTPRSLDARLALSGGWTLVLLASTPALLTLAAVLTYPTATSGANAVGLATMIALAVTAASCWALGQLATDAALRTGAIVTALWFAICAMLALASWSALVPAALVAIGLVLATAVVVTATRLRGAGLARRAPLVVGAHLLLVLALRLSWDSTLLGVIGGIGVVATVAIFARCEAGWGRAIYVAAGYAYALIITAAALTLTVLEPMAILCLATTLAAAAALTTTMFGRVAARNWWAVLAVTAIPFVAGVFAVLALRSGWTALSTASILALALTLVLTRRTGTTRVLRALAATVLVPALALVVVSLCAWLLVSSGSPVALPIVAAVGAGVLGCSALIEGALRRHGLAAPDAALLRVCIEASTLVTAAIAVLLAVLRVAAGLDTTLVVLVLMGIGGVAAARWAGRGYGWLISGASFTGALWCVLSLARVDVLEAYLLPPAVGAAIVGALAVARGLPWRSLYGAALVLALAPSLAQVAAFTSGSDARSYALLASGAALLALGRWFGRPGAVLTGPPLGALAGPTLVAAVAAAASGVLYSLGLGLGNDALVILPVLALSLTAATIAAFAGLALARGVPSRWALAAAAVYFTAGPLTAIRHDWLSIFSLWGVMAVLLAVMVATAGLSRRRAVMLPPVWLTFSLAWCAAVSGWSERELRVEAFSLPLGIALLGAGVLVLRQERQQRQVDLPAVRPGFTSWPVGFTGSWPLLAPGLIVTLAPSVLSTATDPLTIRAILVIVLALAAILVGARLRLAAPFVLGIVVLPIENIVVFLVQIGRSISAAPWWITLASAGAVLLVLAVTAERRDATHTGVVARLRDLG